MKVVSPKEMMRIEELAYADGSSEKAFMNAAGAAIAAHIQELYRDDLKIILLCGSGNNGGDGYVAGRLLRKAGYEVVAFASPPLITSLRASMQTLW